MRRTPCVTTLDATRSTSSRAYENSTVRFAACALQASVKEGITDASVQRVVNQVVESLALPMRDLAVDDTEAACLKAIAFFDPGTLHSALCIPLHLLPRLTHSLTHTHALTPAVLQSLESASMLEVEQLNTNGPCSSPPMFSPLSFVTQQNAPTCSHAPFVRMLLSFHLLSANSLHISCEYISQISHYTRMICSFTPMSCHNSSIVIERIYSYALFNILTNHILRL